MTNEEIKRNIWRNTASNYGCIGLRLVLGLVMFRLLYHHLTKEEFGFWALLWSVFGYGILLDFGFGFTAQKRVAELSAHQRWDHLSRVLSTIFFTYVGIGAFIFLVGGAVSKLLIEGLEIAVENKGRFRELLIYFFCGMGLAFPMGIFPEILRGLQRIRLANVILSAGMAANFLLSVVAIRLGWGLKGLFLIALVCTYIPDLMCGWYARRHLPGVRLRFRSFSPSMVRETMSFSIYAYITTVNNLILTRTDHVVISSLLAVSAVAIYQAGSKAAEMFGAMTQQFQETLSPVAAHLHAKGDQVFLRELLIQGTRFSAMMATPLYCIAAFFMEGFLRVLTGESVLEGEIYWTAQVLLLWVYMVVVTQSVSKRIFMMTGHEKRLTVLGVGEALLNLGLSVALVLYFQNVVCVAVGSLIATAVFGWGYVWPWAAREARVSAWGLARAVLLPIWFACLPLLVLAVFERSVPALDYRQSYVMLALESGLGLSLAMVGMWHWALKGPERGKVVSNLARFFTRRPAM